VSFASQTIIREGGLGVSTGKPEFTGQTPERIIDDQLAQFAMTVTSMSLTPFFVQREGEMVMIDDVMALLRSKNYGDHVLAQEFGALGVAFLTPALSFDLHLRMPTVICVGRSSMIGTGWRSGSRTLGIVISPFLAKPFGSSNPSRQ
jgi:hypothetical protein